MRMFLHQILIGMSTHAMFGVRIFGENTTLVFREMIMTIATTNKMIPCVANDREKTKI